MTSTIIEPTADLIATTIAALAVTPAVKAYTWQTGLSGLGQLPAAIVDAPVVERTEVEQPESQLGAFDWTMTFPVYVFVELKVAKSAASTLVEIVEAFIQAIDAGALTAADPSIVEAKVVSSTMLDAEDQQARPLLAYDCRVEVLKLVA